MSYSTYPTDGSVVQYVSYGRTLYLQTGWRTRETRRAGSKGREQAYTRRVYSGMRVYTYHIQGREIDRETRHCLVCRSSRSIALLFSSFLYPSNRGFKSIPRPGRRATRPRRRSPWAAGRRGTPAGRARRYTSPRCSNTPASRHRFHGRPSCRPRLRRYWRRRRIAVSPAATCRPLKPIPDGLTMGSVGSCLRVSDRTNDDL